MAKEEDILNEDFRKNVLDEIIQNENDYRKEESRRRFDIWRGNLHEIVKEQMKVEYQLETIEQFRAQTSINLVPRVIEEKASLYKHSPTREFTNLTEEQDEYVKDKYKEMRTNVHLKQANKMFKLQDQDCVQLIPMRGMLRNRVLQPHHYDVIGDEIDPTQPIIKIINLNDENKHIQTFRDSTERKLNRNFVDDIIGDWDDQRRLLARFSWYSANYNFITNGFGQVVSDPNDIENSLGELPFIEVSDPVLKDFRYWVFAESLLTRFQIDFCKDLTDLTENVKMQGFAQGLIVATKKPTTIDIGPRKWMYLPLDPNNPDARPSFDFKTPSPDISGQMNIIKDKMRMFFASENIDPAEISGSPQGNTFSSGLERLLSQIQKFEASSDDIDIFRGVEKDYYSKFVKWNNILASESFDGFMMLPEDTEVSVKFHQPEKLETADEREARWIRLRDEGLATMKKSIMEIYQVDEEKAEEIMEDIKKEGMPQVEE